jgi:autotransporter translocation and assembly factor TamB
LHDLLAQPAAYADRVWIENFNLEIRDRNDNTEIRGLHLTLDPEQPGALQIARVKIPRLEPWENLAAETSYVSRNFFIKGLVLTPDIVLEEVNFDASQRAQDKGSVMVKGRFFGGTARCTLAGEQLKRPGEKLERSYATTSTLEAEGIAIDRAIAYFAHEKVPVQRLARLSAALTGEPEKPRTWNGDITARVESLALGPVTIDAVEFGAKVANGQGRVHAAKAIAGANSLEASALVGLPESVTAFDQSDVDADIRINAPDLPALAPRLSRPPRGRIAANGTAALHARRAQLTATIEADNVALDKLAAGSGTLQLNAAKIADFPKNDPLHGLAGDLKGELTNLRYATFQADVARIDLTVMDEVLTARAIELQRGENRIRTNGTVRLLGRPRQIAVDFKIEAPALEAFGIAFKDEVLHGRLTGEGSVRFDGDKLGGKARVEGNDFVLGKFHAQRLAVKADVVDNEALIDECALRIDDENQIALTGKGGASQPFPYEGAILVALKDLSVLQPLLAIAGVRESIGGALNLDWSGNGELVTPITPPLANHLAHSGDVKLDVASGHFGKIEISMARLAGIYGPGFAESREFRVASGPTKLEGAIEVREGRLRLRDLKLDQGAIPVLTGYVLLPIDLEHLEQPIPLDRRVAANLNAKDLDIEKLALSFGQKTPVSGQLTANLVTGGTLLQPSAHLKVAARGLTPKAMPKVDPAELDLTVHYSQNELTVSAEMREPLVQPLTVEGHAPFNLDATVHNKKIDPDLPIELVVRLPQSSLAFIPKFVPAIRRIDGTAAIDARVGGTFGAPQLSGAANVRVESARLTNENVPSIGAFQASLAFADDTLSLKTFRGEVGGGTFSASGNVQLAKLTEPRFDLRILSDEVLVKRDDSITVRVDTDVKIAGPLNAGTASGTVYVTHSRFFRDIDILPIHLPGRPKPKPQPKSVSGPKTISFDKPPLRDWKFDIAIKTRPGDPFKIRGNLARGGAFIDLKLGGTGLHPWLDGNIRVEDFVASLPFSKLSVTRGFIYFKEEAPFEPQLDLQAESTLRDYHVNAYIYGHAEDPQVSLTSEPPLPQQDIVSLLATGTTTSELGHGDALAGRAAVLVFQQLYRKVFKKRDPAEEQGLMERFEFDLGAVDNRTGRQELSARFKLGENYYLVGDVDVAGEFTGRLKYLLRFR